MAADPTMLLIQTLLSVGLVQATPILLPALGEIYAELSGIFVLGLEGIMLTSASVAYVTAVYTNNLYLALLTAMSAGTLMGVLVAVLAIRFKVNQIVLGLGVFLLGQALSSYLVNALSNGLAFKNAQIFPYISVPLLDSVPVLGPVLEQNVLVYAALLTVPLSWLVLFRTQFGLKACMIGEDPAAADNIGLPVFRTRYICTLITAGFASLGGVFMVLGTTGVWIDNITGGKGFIAIALVRLATWRPQWALVFALAFGILDTIQFRLQVLGSSLPHQLLQMVPYFGSVLALLLFSRFKLASQPKSLGTPYVRGQA